MTSTEHEPHTMGATDEEAAVLVLARAFQDDAGIKEFLPNPEDRRRALPSFFRPMVRFGRLHGNGDALGTPPVAVAFWLPPGVGPTAEALGAAGFGDSIATWPAGAAERFGAFVGHLGAEHARLMGEEAHWTLFFTGVEPDQQGHGLGSRLLAPTVETIVASGTPCYTETLEARNVPFYTRLGFHVVAESTTPGGAPVWSLRLG